MCGEQWRWIPTARREMGSPPRVRGTVDDLRLGGGKVGITPACAGNSAYTAAPNSQIGDHPRVCGEQPYGFPSYMMDEGSPPRVRGTVLGALLSAPVVRITPACAGNRTKPGWGGNGIWDHPRVCGEQMHRKTHLYCNIGSPPRVRGTGLSDSAHRTPVRITPACAGNSPCSHSCRAPARDHPRVCGEQFSTLRENLGLWGSPPRVRGTDLPRLIQLAVFWITPACAGNSQTIHLLQIRQKDHPRVCGEQGNAWVGDNAQVGSPPRVRGTVIPHFLIKPRQGITPACAGNR